MATETETATAMVMATATAMVVAMAMAMAMVMATVMATAMATATTAGLTQLARLKPTATLPTSVYLQVRPLDLASVPRRVRRSRIAQYLLSRPTWPVRG